MNQNKLSQEEIARCKAFIAGVEPQKRTRVIFNLFGIFRQTGKINLKEYLEPEDYTRFMKEYESILSEYGQNQSGFNHSRLEVQPTLWDKRKLQIIESFTQ